MDVHDKLDELSALVESARAMPMSASCVVNRAQVLDLLDEARGLLPTSLAQADDVLADREDIVAAAKVSAAEIIARADEEARLLVSEHEVYRVAVAEADAVRADADAEARRMRRETDDYVDAKLANFEVALHKTIAAVQKGRDKIRGRHDFEELGGPVDDTPLPGLRLPCFGSPPSSSLRSSRRGRLRCAALAAPSQRRMARALGGAALGRR